MSELRTDFKDEILQEGEEHRIYSIKRKGTDEIVESDIYLEKAYTPLQEGNEFGAKEVNEIHGRLNGLAPQNLLVNGDFHCWQRGEVVNLARTTGGYTADMWYCENKRDDSEMKVYKVHENSFFDDIVKPYYELYGSGISALGHNGLRVYYRMPIEEAEKYNGKTVTLSYSLNKQITVMPSYVFNITEQDRTNGYVECFYLLMSAEQVLNWVRLDEGNIAYQHIPEDHATALLRCQEWVYGVITDDFVRLPLGLLASDTIQVPLPFVNLKSYTSVIINGDFDVRCAYPNWWNIAYRGSITGASFNYQVKMFQFKKPSLSGVPDSGQIYSIESQIGAILILTCEPL